MRVTLTGLCTCEAKQHYVSQLVHSFSCLPEAQVTPFLPKGRRYDCVRTRAFSVQ